MTTLISRRRALAGAIFAMPALATVSTIARQNCSTHLRQGLLSWKGAMVAASESPRSIFRPERGWGIGRTSDF